MLGVVVDHPYHWVKPLDAHRTITSAIYEHYKILFDDISDRYRQLIATRRQGHHRPDLKADFQCDLDLITDEWQSWCGKLSTSRATTSEHLRLKAQSLLCLLPEDHDPAVILAESLCGDLIAHKPITPAINRVA